MRGGGHRYEPGCVVMIFMAALVSASAADDPTTAEKVQTPRPLAGEVTAVEAHVENGVSVSARTPTLFPISRELVFDNYVVFPDGTTVHQFRPPTLTASERVIYSDTLGKVVLPMPVNQLIADDITTTTPDGCNLTRFTFQTTGRANPNQDGGAYSVSYALYSFCPRSVAQANRPSLIIPGTSGTVAFPDDGFHILTVLLPPNTSIPTNFYLGISANRSNVGIIMGAPPLIGLSCDVIDHPVLACGATLGGFPDQPYASFNAEFFADDDTCPTSFVAYRNDNPKQSAFLTGANHPIYDDLHLNTNNCLMTSYEVMVKGSGYYSFELSTSCGGAAIPGTHVEQPVTATPGVPNKLAFKLDPPVHVPQDLWLSAMVNNSTAGIIMTGRDACTGHTADFLCDPSGLVLLSPPDNLQEAFDITITCVGSPPVGACCDMFVLDDNGEAVCRQVPQMNCPFPPVGDNIARPKWVPGA
ncbi:MAG: hypothetical protein HY287_18425, partial [Planctomycetes bacterium]|nr:hypothetical protein [Planctomycetota bacterium]